MLYFVAGVAVTLVVMLGLFSTQKAEAGDPYACIRTALTARGMSGNVPQPSFMITYAVPSCLKSNGYKVSNVNMRSGEVAVTYKK